jgi:hypothetical protein
MTAGLFMLLMVMAAPLHAAQGQIDLKLSATAAVDVDRDIPIGKQAGRYDVAVLVGNGNYRRRGVPAVDFAHNDLRVVRRYLERAMGFAPENIIVEKDATKGTLEMLFGNVGHPEGKLFNYVRAGESRVFVYYVGHGAPNPKTGEGFLVPVDADPDYIATSGYPLSTFYANLKNIPAKELIVVIDACFSGQTQEGLLLKNISPAMLKIKESAAGITKGAVLSSSHADQLSIWYPEKRHSLFTYYFLKGLQGAADVNGDNKITTGEIDAYVSDEVPYWARRLAGKHQQPRVEGKKDIVLATYK